jgi:GntR family transcriptional regulator
MDDGALPTGRVCSPSQRSTDTETQLFSLHPGSGVPIYRQLIDQIRRLVAAGQLRSGAELPSIRDLAVKYAVNPMTISKAYALLEAEGLLMRNRGKPMTVVGSRRTQAPLSQRLQQLDPQLAQLIDAAQQLDVPCEDMVALLERRWGESHRYDSSPESKAKKTVA